MRKIIFMILFGLANSLFANINAIVSILPQKTFLKAIGKDKVNITLMVRPGNSPHTYEPKPSQMKSISKADIYFSIDVEFEKVWLPKFRNQNQNMIISNVAQGISKINIKHNSHNTKQSSKDPHIWTSPQNTKQIALNILNSLIKIDVVNKSFYEKNYADFVKSIEQTDKNIRNILKDIPRNSKFMVFHPAWGYFAKYYNLQQLAIEVEGKNPKPKTIRYIIEEAKKENIKAILTAPEFSTKTAKLIAKELNIKVIKISPLNPNWGDNLENLAKTIANSK